MSVQSGLPDVGSEGLVVVGAAEHVGVAQLGRGGGVIVVRGGVGVLRGAAHRAHRAGVAGRAVLVDAADGERVGRRRVGRVGDGDLVADLQVVEVGERLGDDDLAVVRLAIAEHFAGRHRERAVRRVGDGGVRRESGEREVAGGHHHDAKRERHDRRILSGSFLKTL